MADILNVERNVAEANKRKEEETKKIKPATDEVIFQTQCYLMDLIDQVSKGNFETKYQYFRIVHGDSPKAITNMFGTKRFEPFWSLTPEQFAKLQPMVKIVKIFYDEEGNENDYAEFPFDEYYNDTEFSVLNPKLSLGGGAGLKNFQWSFKSKNPAASANVVDASFSIRFATFDDLVKTRRVTTKNGTREMSFLDLVLHQRKDISTPCEPESTYNPHYYSFKVIVGWADPRGLDPDRTQEFKNLGKVMRDDRKTIVLSLARHNIRYTQEGVVFLDIECNGYLDVVSKLDESDVFLPYRKKFFYDFYDNNLFEEGVKVRQLDECNTIDNVGDEADQNKRKEIAKEILVKKEKNLGLLKTKIYSAFMSDLLSSDRVFSVVLPKSYTELDLDWSFADFITPGERSSKFQTLGRADSASKRDQIKNAPRINVVKYSGANIISPALIRAGQTVAKGDLDDTFEAQTSSLKKANEDMLYDSFNDSSETLTIPFIYFGDIINFALKAIYGENRYINSKRYKSLVTDILLYNPRLKKKLSVNLADIPISIALFQDWFIENIYARQLVKYPAKTFLQDLFSGLLVEALKPQGCHSDVPTKSVMVAFLEYTIGTESDKDPLDPNNCGRLHMSTVREIRKKSTNTPDSHFYNYSVFYASETDASTWRAVDPETDAKRGIPWFTLGRDRGLIKTIDFERNDTPHFREANLFNSDRTDGLNVLREVYRADIKMIGNNFFYPGQMIFINPSTVVFGNPTNTASIASKIGLVGYYMVMEVESSIEPGKYDTNIRAIWQAGGSGRSDDIVVMQSKKNSNELTVCDCKTSSFKSKIEEVNKINWTAVETVEIAPDKLGC